MMRNLRIYNKCTRAHRRGICLYGLLLTALLSACGGPSLPDDEAASRQASAFAEAYFSLRIDEAMQLATPESRQWLRLMASGLTQADLDVLNNCDDYEPPLAEVTGLEHSSDSVARVKLRMNRVLLMDSLERPAHMADDVETTVTVVKRDGRWKVRMEGLPRNERHSRD